MAVESWRRSWRRICRQRLTRGVIRGLAVCALAICNVLLSPNASAQAMLGTAGGKVHLVGSDQAVLESQEVRKEISCTVTPVKPLLGLDLRYHAGYSVTIPLKELAGTGNVLNILFRVTSLDRGAEPALCRRAGGSSRVAPAALAGRPGPRNELHRR